MDSSQDKKFFWKENKPVIDIILELLSVSENFSRSKGVQTLFNLISVSKVPFKEKSNEIP